MKLLQENIGEIFLNTALGIDLMDMMPQTYETKLKINKWVGITLKSFSAAEKTINKIKRQYM